MGDASENRGYQWPEPPRHTTGAIAREGLPLLYGGAFVTAVLALLGLTVPALIGLAATGFIGFFFRDPDRIVPRAEGGIVSPADGRVIKAETADGGEFFQGSCLKVSIFMSVFNAHVNRIPSSGTVREVRYHPGKFFNASFDKASAANERNAVFMELADGRRLCMVQIAGLVARRIICRIQAGDSVERGQRFGLICFGSRVDLYLPPETELSVAPGHKVRAGASIIGFLK